MYTYAFLPAAVPLMLPEGIAGSLTLVHTPILSALVEPDLDFALIQASDDRLMQAVLSHDRVLRDVFRQTVMLPLRFGTCFVSHEGIVHHLQANVTQYLEKLNQLAGKAEYTLKLIPLTVAEPEISPDTAGREYFLAKKQRYQTQLEQQHQQRAELETIKQAIAHYPHQMSNPDNGIERIHLLAPCQEDAILVEQLHIWQATCPHWEITLGEALPPYHFV